MLRLRFVLGGRPGGRRDAGKIHLRSAFAFAVVKVRVGRSSGAAKRKSAVAIPPPMERRATVDRAVFHGNVPVDGRGVLLLRVVVEDALCVDDRTAFCRSFRKGCFVVV